MSDLSMMDDKKIAAKLKEVGNLLGGNPLLLLAAARIEELTNKELEPRILQLEYALALMVCQYCRDCDNTHVTHLCMSAGEHAFAMLGLKDYTPVEVVEDMYERMENEMADRWPRLYGGAEE